MFNKQCVINAPTFFNGIDWSTLLINFLIIKPQSNIFLSIYLIMQKFFFKNNFKKNLILKYIYVIFWIIISSFVGYSYFLLKIIFIGIKSLFYKNPAAELFNNINFLIKNYDISNKRIICDTKIWLNPYDQIKKSLKLIINYKEFIKDPNFNDAIAYAKEHGFCYKITEESIATITPSGDSKFHKFIIGNWNNSKELILVRTHDCRNTIISKQINNKEEYFSQAQFKESIAEFKIEQLNYKTSEEVIQQIYSTLGIKFFYNPSNQGFLNSLNEPSKIISFDNGFLQKDVNLMNMAKMVNSLELKYSAPTKVIEAIINQAVINDLNIETINSIVNQIDFL